MNEEETFEELYFRVKKTMDCLSVSYEIIFVDDGSEDKTSELILKYGKKDHNIVGVNLSRNFGQDDAISAGLRVSEGLNIIVLDGDLQDPPEVIPNLIKEKQKGYDVVYGIKTDRKEGVVITGLTSLFYKFMYFLSGIRMPQNVGTFSIFTQQVGNAILNFPESNMFFSGVRCLVGFKQVGIKYKREKRTRGQAKSFFVLARMAMNAIFSYSMLPLRFVILICSIVAVLTGCLFLFYIYQPTGEVVEIINSNIFFEALIFFLFSIVLLILVMIAEVVGRIDGQVKRRPNYIIESIIKNGDVIKYGPYFKKNSPCVF
jgi:polyisoprenyl-phosphate glycosyltransferase